MNDPYAEAVARVHATRDVLAACQQAYNTLLAAFEMAHEAERTALTTAHTANIEAEEHLRQCAVERYVTTGDTQLSAGVQIRITHRPQYSPAEALAWCIEHKLCLAVDHPSFLAVAQALGVLCVTYQREVTVHLPAIFPHEEDTA